MRIIDLKNSKQKQSLWVIKKITQDATASLVVTTSIQKLIYGIGIKKFDIMLKLMKINSITTQTFALKKIETLYLHADSPNDSINLYLYIPNTVKMSEESILHRQLSTK